MEYADWHMQIDPKPSSAKPLEIKNLCIIIRPFNPMSAIKPQNQIALATVRRGGFQLVDEVRGRTAVLLFKPNFGFSVA